MKFNYRARTEKGAIQTGEIEASSKEAALSLLQKHKFFVTSLKKAEDQPFYAKKIKLFGGVSGKEMVIFSRQLSLMFKAKIPLLEALQAIAKQTKKPVFKEKIFAISEDVENGTLFSQALSCHPKLFSPFYCNMVKSGEASGTLSESLSYLADHLEREYELSSKIKGAMAYPVLVLVVATGVLVMMMIFVIPNLTAVLTETGQELPTLTKVVISLSDFLKKFGWLLFLLFLGLLIFVLRYSKTAAGKKIWDKLVLKIPLVGHFLKMIYISRFAENLSTLIVGGLPITRSLEITGQVVGNDVYQTIISQIESEVRKGEQITSVLVRYPEEFPPLLAQMVAVGEKTGSLGQSLMQVVDFYRKETDRTTDNLLSILEPALIIFLGVVVAGLMAAVLMPLYNISSF